MSELESQLMALFHKVALEITGKKYPEVTLETPIGELGIDSFGQFEILARIEDEMKVQFTDEGFSRIRTLRDIAEEVEVVRNKGPAT